jgi:V/A-type H+-transporting ATPase subunit C
VCGYDTIKAALRPDYHKKDTILATVELSENPEYGFAVGRVRALEAAFMGRVRYERFIRTRGAAEFVAALAETAYARFFEGQSADVPRAFDGATRENVAFLCSYALDEWLTRLFRLPSMFRRLKTALKGALLRGEADVVIPDGTVGDLEEALVAALVAEATAAFAKKEDPVAVDVVADRLMQEVQLRVASPSEFVVGFLCLHADLENLRALTRVKARSGAEENGRAEMQAAFMPGGTLALDDLVAALPEPWPAVVESLARARPYGTGDEAFREYLEQGSSAVAGRRSYVRLERLGREMELRYLQQTRYATFGYEPLVTFFLMGENELRNLRLLYAAKLAGLSDEETRELVACVD